MLEEQGNLFEDVGEGIEDSNYLSDENPNNEETWTDKDDEDLLLNDKSEFDDENLNEDSAHCLDGGSCSDEEDEDLFEKDDDLFIEDADDDLFSEE